MAERIVKCWKCGQEFAVNLAPERPRACPGCSEPSPELLELDRCDWSSGDFYPDKAERG